MSETRKTVLTVNAGSSSLRLAAFTYGGGLVRLAEQHYDTHDSAGSECMRTFLQSYTIPPVTLVGHRVVHGGDLSTVSCIVDALVEAEIERVVSLAPLHNPPAIAAIRDCRTLFGADVPQVAVFDTAFYAELPEAARTYAIPHDLSRKHRLRRYGFHGIAHRALWQRWRQLRPEVPEGGRVISVQLGAGCSMTAVEHAAPRDTSMGFSPLEGLMMATRGGDIDPGVITYLQQHEVYRPDVMEQLLYGNCGLQGVAGESDMRRVLARQDAQARLAVEMYCHRARKYLGAYLAVLGGADAILIGGGVGENAPFVRGKILDNMEWAGIELDAQANRAVVGIEARISRPQSRTAIWVIPVDEAAILAQEAVALMRKRESVSRKENKS